VNGVGKLRFYTLPPKGVEWPWLFVNPKQKNELKRRNFAHAILDPGVGIFRVNPGLKDYPPQFLHYWKYEAKKWSRITRGSLWVTIPDYPDDYHPGQFGDNIEKTLKNIKEFITFDGVEWLPVIQSRYLNIFSFYESCELLKKLIKAYPRVAIGTVCKTRRLKFIIDCCKITRKFFPNAWIHAFGLTIQALPKVKEYINSFDSVAYTFPVLPEWRNDGRRWRSARTKAERMKYFYAYLRHLKAILGSELE